MRRWQKILISLATALFLILFAAAVILPEVIRDKAIEQVREQYGRELKIERIIINIFNLQADIRKLDLKDPGSERTFVSFDRLKFSLSLRSLIDRALIIDDLTLDHPFVQLEKTGENSFNFSDFIPAEEPQAVNPEESTPFHFSFNNLQIRSGSLVFYDSSNEVDLVHHVDSLDLAVPFVGNIPYLVKRYIQPAVSLQIDGSPLKASGQMKPFDQSVETRLELNLNNVDIPFYAAYLQPFLPFELTSGSLSTQLELSYRVSRTQQPKLLIGGDISLSALRLEQEGEQLFFLPLLLVQIDWANPFADEFHFSNISIYDPQLQVRRNAEGRLNLLELVNKKAVEQPSTTETPEATESTPLPRVTVETLRLREGIIHFTDQVPTRGFQSRLYDINLLSQNLSTGEQPPATLLFELKTSHHESLRLEGDLKLVPFRLTGHFSLNDIPLGDYAPYLEPYLVYTPTGHIRFQTDLALTADEQQLNQLNFKLSDFHQPFNDSERYKMAELFLSDASVSLPQKQVKLAELAVIEGDLNFARSADDRLPFAALLKEQPAVQSATVSEQTNEPPANDWQLELAQLRVENFRTNFIDKAAPKPAAIGMNSVNIRLSDLHWPQSVASAWQFSGAWDAGGTFSGAGQLRHTPVEVKGTFGLDQLDLTPVNSYVPPEVLLTLDSAKLDTNLKFELHQDKKLLGNLKGDLGLRKLSVTGISEELLRWESLQLSDILLEIDPLSLVIEQVSLNNYLAKIRVRDDGKVNLNQITAEQEESAQSAANVKTAEKEVQTPPPIRINELTLQGGEVSFIDKHLPKIFSSTMYNLGGRISGLTSEPGKFASVDLRGSLENNSPLTINGKIAPLAGDLDTELKVRFNDIDLAPVTPYSGTYLGYSVEKGKLYLDLDYKISQRQVTASNKIFLDQFTFGEAVESEEATSLPVRLAVALLKDRKGEIHLDLPVTGSTDDPEFGIFSTVMTLLKNLLVKAATAPFSLLASMFGGGGEDFSQLDFAPGLASLTPADQEKLSKLNQMLVERPSLSLEISAFIDPERDPEGYRKEKLRRMIEEEWRKRKKPQPDQAITPDEYLENMRRVYSRAKFPKPRNTLGLQKKLPAAEMEKLLLANERVEEEQLAGLARERAAAVKEDLIRQNPELAPRIYLKNSEVRKPPESGKNPARVEFGIAAN